MHARSLLFILLCLSYVPLSEALGQQADTTQLPEIAPREIEIRGERQIALPALERQPLSGFTSPPRIPTLPPDHHPFVKPYKQELGELPESLPLPTTTTEPVTPRSEPHQGFVEGGGGRYYSRFFESRVVVPVSSREHFSFHGRYTGTEGFTPFQSEPIDTPSDVAEAQIRFESTRDPVQVAVNLHGSAERYTLYGVTPATDQADREGYSVGSFLRLKSLGRVPAMAAVRYDRTKYRTSFPSRNTGEHAVYRQGKLELFGFVTAPVPLRPHVNASYNHSWLGGDPQNDTGFSADVAGTLSFSRSEPSFLEIGARGLTFDSPAHPLRDTTSHVDAFYLAPVVNFEWRLTDGVRVHIRNRPRLREASLYRLYGENPYAMHAPSLRPTIVTTNAEGGLTFASGPIRLIAAAGYRYAPTYRFFEPGAQGGYKGGVYQVHYGTARILQGRGQIVLQGVEGVQASLGVSVRDGSLGEGETIIPNFAPVTADAMLSVSFNDGNGFFEVLSHFESARYASRDEKNRLDPYFTLDVEGSYALSPSIEVLARVENLAFQTPTLWAGYPRPPAQVALGLRIRW